MAQSSLSLMMLKAKQDEENQRINVLQIQETSYVLHSFRVLSEEPDNMEEPSGEKQQHESIQKKKIVFG